MNRDDETAIYNSTCTLLRDLNNARCGFLNEHDCQNPKFISVLERYLDRARRQAHSLMTSAVLSKAAINVPLYKELLLAIADLSIDLNHPSFVPTAASIVSIMQRVRSLPMFRDVPEHWYVPSYLEYDQ